MFRGILGGEIVKIVLVAVFNCIRIYNILAMQ